MEIQAFEHGDGRRYFKMEDNGARWVEHNQGEGKWVFPNVLVPGVSFNVSIRCLNILSEGCKKWWDVRSSRVSI
eukprot:4929009-Lingulodinium_polyedra.AAC.1